GEPVAPADDGEADVLAHDLFAFLDEVLLEERHQEVDFFGGPFPIFSAEAIEGELFDAEPATFLDGTANAADAFEVALDAFLAAFLGPAAVAIHDDGDMARQLRGIEPGVGKAFQSFWGQLHQGPVHSKRLLGPAFSGRG